jgi:hypothetical protein
MLNIKPPKLGPAPKLPTLKKESLFSKKPKASPALDKVASGKPAKANMTPIATDGGAFKI